MSKFGEARFSDLANPKLQPQDYTVSSNKEEWKYVQRLLPLTLKPVVPKKDYYPSGKFIIVGVELFPPFFAC